MPSVRTMRCREPRSIWEKDFTATTSSEIRRVASLTSPSRPTVEKVLATHRTAASRPAPPTAAATSSHQEVSAPTAASAAARLHASATSWLSSQAPISSSASASASGSGTPSGARSCRRRVSRAANWRSGDLRVREPSQRRQQGGGAGLQGVDRPGRGGGGVVDLVGEAGGQGAQRDEGLPLPHGRLDAARRVVEPLDQVHGEGEPRDGAVLERLRRHPQHPARLGAAPGGEVDALLVPGPEPARPAPGDVHVPDDDLLAADLAGQLHGAVDEHPPVVRVAALDEECLAGDDRDLVAVVEKRPAPGRRSVPRTGRGRGARRR